jgi:predicted TPR repeat methyltransferase
MSLPETYFDGLYADSPDPWSLASRWYEQRKYALTIASLPRERYRRGFEVGSSVGVLTELLAARCDALLSVDIAAAAVTSTRDRVSALPHVQTAQLTVPDQWPSGSFDLIVLSEVGYYLDASALAVLIDKAVGSLDEDGSIVAVHWRHHVADYPLDGDTVHAALHADSRLAVLAHHEERDFLLDVLVRFPLRSVAEAAGLVTE